MVLWDKDESANLETKRFIEDLGHVAHAYTVNLEDRQQIYATADRVRSEVGDVELLLNNAGIVSGRNLFDCSDELMEKTMIVNTHSLFYVG